MSTFISHDLLANYTAYREAIDSVKLKDALLNYYSYGKGEPVIILSGGPGIAFHQEDDLTASLS